ncbi:hypothetical protein GCM10012280_68980 [Wenjunlia tyrosinilytica]|uniref:Uncharacterized protein n=1 Tax=Wenjunlia tyrosinilytica TaxID=1544741 RepID=A0A918E2V9_9ACTN|nr:hypothetical protein GCM10012280_68980 [Wenjunlia tyrosinilytica]
MPPYLGLARFEPADRERLATEGCGIEAAMGAGRVEYTAWRMSACTCRQRSGGRSPEAAGR